MYLVYRKEELVHCSICQKAKQKRLTFPSQNNMSEHAFDLVHIDTWGPFGTPTVEGYMYFLTIVDDYSRATWIFLMKTKNEVLHIFPRFLTMVETQYKTQVKAVRSDNAPELGLKTYTVRKVLFPITHALKHLSRTQWWRENISIY